MLLSIVDGFSRWLAQLKGVLMNRFDHLTPTEYCTMLVACICIGWLLLRGRN